MYIQAATVLFLFLIMTKGSPTSKSTVTIGIMVDAQFDVESISGVVDNVTNIYRLSQNQGYHLEVKWQLCRSIYPTYITRIVSDMIHAGVQAVITVLRCSQRRTVSAMTETFKIPHLSVDLDLCPPSEKRVFTLHLTSPYMTMSRALVDIAEAAGWEQIQLSFNKIADYITRQQLVVQLTLAGIKTLLPRPSTDNSIMDRTVVVMQNSGANTQNNDDSIKLTKVTFVQGLTPGSLRALQGVNNHTDILAVQVNPLSICPRFDLIGLENDTDITFLQVQISQAVLMFHNILHRKRKTDLTVNTTVVCSANHHDVFTDGSGILKLLALACDAGESHICHQLNKPVEYNLYFIPVGSDRDPIPLGQWTENTGLSITTTYPDITNRLFPHKLNDFGGITLRVLVGGKTHPYSFWDDSGNGSYAGVMIDIMDDLANKLNFRYTVTQPSDGQTGSKNSDGTFTGMIGFVARGEADIGAASLTVNTERSEVVDFTTSFMQDSLGILTPKTKQSADLFQLFKPFKLPVWLAILGAVLVASVAFVSISLMSPVKATDPAKPQALLAKCVGEHVLLIMSSYFEQGPTFHPTAASSRCFLGFWLVFHLMIMAIYTADLAAVLAVSTPVKPIDTLQDLADRTDMRVLVKAGAVTQSIFGTSPHTVPVYKEIGTRLEASNDYGNRFDLVRKGSHCFIHDRSLLEFVAAESCGELRLARDRFYGFPLAFIITKNSPYKAAIDLSLQKMVESGHIVALLRKWMTPRTDCPITDAGEAIEELALNTIGGIFIVYLGVIFVSVIFCLVEFLRRRYFCHSNADHLAA